LGTAARSSRWTAPAGAAKLTAVNGRSAVERYLEALAAHDWDALAATIAETGLVREGPFSDVVEGKAAYVEFLRSTVTALAGYHLAVHRVSPASEEVTYVELTETVEVEGVPTRYKECIVFETDGQGLIRGVSVYLKQPAGA
jgi:hypothetical protein